MFAILDSSISTYSCTYNWELRLEPLSLSVILLISSRYNFSIDLLALPILIWVEFLGEKWLFTCLYSRGSFHIKVYFLEVYMKRHLVQGVLVSPQSTFQWLLIAMAHHRGQAKISFPNCFLPPLWASLNAEKYSVFK